MYLYVTTLAKNLPLMNFVSAIPFFIYLMRHPIVQRMMMPSLKAKVGVGKIKGVVGQIVGQRFGENKVVREDMIQSFIKNGLTQGEIADEGMLQLFAGSDTTSTVLRSGLFYIITNPRVCTRLQAECDASGVPLTEIISAAKGPTLPYLNACVKEALRYHPAGTGLLPRVVGPNGDYHEGKYLPPGTTIGFCGWNVFKNNSAYGPDYSEFRPERWFDADPERLARMEKAHDLVFGYGRYKCMGEKIARIELHKAIFELIRRFNFTAVDAMKPFDQYENHGVFVQHGLWVRAEERVPKTKE
ncbi:uncharacterized protein A1O5_01764 [Cladophialophora psammophila CBS 110553]|uniref:Cytochrome P450 oxidoreductase n=1 Tax=Cladophialophora psammophila CBS 110553 TaxID=1182543 RepID=W9X4E1_9EURO|nr:uncharacterized protein A1O5_01764 [Cladophialophora psammophila CBS 110553]EXJ75068.1 hypothetical protein A1O5_01764 [Cladophialophora psammophila CBS 110553]